MRCLCLILMLLVSLNNQAQTTTIPDASFEQALLNLQIDSDGQLNGQVLTADINTITVLEIGNRGIQDLTGIEDFTALEVLNCADNNLTFLDVSANLQLKELYAGNPGELPENSFSSIDLNSNNLLEVLWLKNIPELENIYLKNSNNAILTDVNITCSIEGAACNTAICIEVDNVQAANNSQAPYASWAFDTGANFSENCNLQTLKKVKESIKFFPNPTSGEVFIANQHQEMQSLQVFDIAGKLVQEISTKNISAFSMRKYPAGLYFLKYRLGNNFGVQKIIKR